MKTMILPVGVVFMVWLASQTITGGFKTEKISERTGTKERHDTAFFQDSDYPDQGGGVVIFRLSPGQNASKKLVSYLLQPSMQTILFHAPVPTRLQLEGEIAVPPGKKLSFAAFCIRAWKQRWDKSFWVR